MEDVEADVHRANGQRSESKRERRWRWQIGTRAPLTGDNFSIFKSHDRALEVSARRREPQDCCS